MVIQQLLGETGPGHTGHGLVSVETRGVEAPADWDTLESPETYTGYDRTENFASPGGAVPGQPHVYSAPAELGRNHWALSGDWTIDGQPPGEAHGADADSEGAGALAEQRLYQLIRQRGPVADRSFEIAFTDPGAQAYVFTFG